MLHNSKKKHSVAYETDKRSAPSILSNKYEIDHLYDYGIFVILCLSTTLSWIKAYFFRYSPISITHDLYKLCPEWNTSKLSKCLSNWLFILPFYWRSPLVSEILTQDHQHKRSNIISHFVDRILSDLIILLLVYSKTLPWLQNTVIRLSHSRRERG